MTYDTKELFGKVETSRQIKVKKPAVKKSADKKPAGKKPAKKKVD